MLKVLGEAGRGGLDAAVAAAWVGFRQWLADRLVGLGEVGALQVDLVCAADEGGTPYLRFEPVDGGCVRATAFDAQGGQVWVTRRDVPSREVDGLAVAVVELLRTAYAVTHPALLVADGLVDPFAQAAGSGATASAADGPDDESPVSFSTSSEQLRSRVDRALEPVLDGAVWHDDDGDVPVRAGRSLLFVRVLDDAPVVEIFAHLVIDPTNLDRLPTELNLLNRSHGDATFYFCGDHVAMRRRLLAQPFLPEQLREVLDVMTAEVDVIAGDLAARVGGRRFLEVAPEPGHTWTHPGWGVFLELLHDGELSPAVVARVFDRDRSALLGAIDTVRDGLLDLGEHDPADLERLLRAGLRHLVGGGSRRPLPPGAAATESADRDRSA